MISNCSNGMVTDAWSSATVRCSLKYDKKEVFFASKEIIIQSQNIYRDQPTTPLVPKTNVLYRGRDLNSFFDKFGDLVEAGCPSKRMSFDRFLQSEVLMLENNLSAFGAFNKFHCN